MRSTRHVYIPLLLLFLLMLSTSKIVRADDEADEYDVKARVVRISLIAGEATLKRAGNPDWEHARLNLPLVEGDTVSTDRMGRLEIQVDARNFVRLGANSVLRILSLRDEGVALSVLEGTVAIRLAKFDREHEYFEVDAPHSTLAAEKMGLYRIDVGQEGRVRFTVRDGGSARIYSETSGFALRDGRAAELVYEGSNAGDWELLAAAVPDDLDKWLADREQYLAQRMRYDVQYYDEYVWGAEDLDSYGDWSYTSDYGWLWRPRPTTISIYGNWAPYRYGYWTWVEPYGWSWVGYEPWGWAPYHYGRWVYYNGFWAWCPRSQYYRNRSWWRPALVAFVSIDFDRSFCWYPLGYYQRDPRSRHYNTHRHPTGDHPGHWGGVTSAPATEIGSDRYRPIRVSDKLARQVMRAEPIRKGLPIRRPDTGSGRAIGGSGDVVVGARPTRVTPVIQIPDRRTGAGMRTPGASLDDELRRSRILNGRDPRPAVPTEPTITGVPETPPMGAVSRPSRGPREVLDPDSGARDTERNSRNANSGGRPGRPVSTPGNGGNAPSITPAQQESPAQPKQSEPDRIVRPLDSDSVEKRSRDRRERIETAPRTEQRTDTPTPRYEAPPTTPRNEPPSEPRNNSRNERGREPSNESRGAEPSVRPERPSQNEPIERATPRSEPRSEPRPEPRSEQRSEPPPQPRSEPTRSEPSRSEPQRSESPRPEPNRSEPSRSEPPRPEEKPPRKPDNPNH